MASLMMNDILTSVSVNQLTNRIIYRHLLVLREPKVVSDHINIDFSKTWKCLHDHTPSDNRDLMLRLIHDKIPVPERLCRVGVRANSSCDFCPGQKVADTVHFFCSCIRVQKVWLWIRKKMAKICQSVVKCSDWELLHLYIPRSMKQNCIVWLISNYTVYAWKWFLTKEAELDLKKFHGFLTFKYKENGQTLNSIGQVL